MKIGNDNGNSEHDIKINGKLINRPNVYAKVRKLPNFDEVNKDYVLKNIENNLIVTCEDPSGIYYLGNYALKSAKTVRSIEIGIDNNKVENDIILVNTLAQIAGYAAVEYFNTVGNFDDIIKTKVDMTTSLPVSYYSHKKALDFSNKFLSKKHMVTVHVGNSNARVEIEFTFVKTIPEGVTATFALNEASKELFEEHNKKDNDELDKEFFKNAKVLHVAIGEGTTEYPITTGIEFNPEFIQGTNNGGGHAIDKALEEFKTAKGLSKFTRQDYSEVIKDKNHKFHEFALEIVEQYIEEQAEEILIHAKQEIQKANNDIDVVCVYGGGSILMRKSLEENLRSFCDRAQIKLFYVPEKYTINLECEGLYNFTNSKIFAILKDKYTMSKA
nr:ParM/StbA family protein [Clostridium sp.]